MNFYDKVHTLVRELKETPEYSNYMLVKEKVKKEAELFKQIKEFKEEQRKEHMNVITNNAVSEERKKALQEKYASIIKNPLAVEFFESEIKLDVLLADMQKILSEGLKDVIEL